MIQEKFITVSINKRSLEEARNYFTRVYSDLSNHFNNLGSKCYELDADDRLKLVHDFYRIGDENNYNFDMLSNMKKVHSFKDYICPDSFDIEKDYFNEYMIWGGMPQRFVMEDEYQIRTYLADVFNSIVIKDIVDRFKIKDLDLFNRIIEYIVITPSQTFSAESLSNYLLKENVEVSKITIYNYLEYMCKTIDEITDKYNFTVSQKENLKELLNNDYLDLWNDVIYQINTNDRIFPVGGIYTITTNFSNEHKALDIASSYGSEIYAINDGIVTISKEGCVIGDLTCNGKAGNYITIKHYDSNYSSSYMHLKSINVKVGDKVKKGQVILKKVTKTRSKEEINKVKKLKK